MPTIKHTNIEQYINLNAKTEIEKERMLELHNFLLKYLEKYKIVASIGYNIPVYNYKGRPAVYFAFAKNHISFNIPPYGLYQHFEHELKDYTLTKSAMHLPHNQEIDYGLIGSMLDYRVAEMEKFEHEKFNE
jgi:uncharacterized protein YdhG (YjbR/CyaY superfamily)